MNIQQTSQVETSKSGLYLTDFQRRLLNKKILETDLNNEYKQRIEIMLMCDRGYNQSQICRTLGCSPLTARHWMLMAKSGQAHQWEAQPIGRPKIINEQFINRLKELIIINPKDFGYSFSRWTGKWLSKHLAKELNIEVSPRHINRLVKDIKSQEQLFNNFDDESKLNLGESFGENKRLKIYDIEKLH